VDHEGQRAEYVAWLRAAAERRFGDARARELSQTIEDVAGWMLEVATFPVATEEAPAFYAEPEPLP
jgi:hypothetical protein